MGKVKKIVALGLIAVASFVFVGCDMIQKTPEAIKKETLAKIGDEKITRGDLDKLMEPYYEELKQQYGENYKDNAQAKSQILQAEKQQLNALVNEKILLKEATELKLVPNDEEMKKEIEDRKKFLKELYGSEEKYKAAMEQAGYTEETFNTELKDEIIASKVMEYINKDVKVTDEDVKKYYDDNKAQFTVQPGATVYHILVKDERTANQIEQKLKDGAKFADLAKEYGTDGTKNNGGSLGYIPYDSTEYDKDFMAAVKKLKKDGEVSAPVKTQFGYHIIKVEGIHTKEEVQSFNEVKEQIKTNLENQKKQENQTETLDKWKKELGVKIYEDKLNQ